MKLICVFLFSSLLAEEPVCHRCEIIREYNKEHPGDYEFYEDYLKAHPEEAKKPEAPPPPKTK